MICKKTNEKLHSILIHKEKKKVIGCINRDVNAVRNFKTIIKYYLANGCDKRPQAFTRKNDQLQPIVKYRGVIALLQKCVVYTRYFVMLLQCPIFKKDTVIESNRNEI